MPKVTAQITSTNDELHVTQWGIDWEYEGKRGHCTRVFDSSIDEAAVLAYFERHVETEARLS